MKRASRGITNGIPIAVSHDVPRLDLFVFHIKGNTGHVIHVIERNRQATKITKQYKLFKETVNATKNKNNIQVIDRNRQRNRYTCNNINTY